MRRFRRSARILGIAAVDGPSEPTHQRSYLGSDLKLASRTGLHDTDAFDTTHRCSLSPFASSHVHLGMVNPEGLDLDHSVAGHRLGFWNLFDYQVFNATESINDYRTHSKPPTNIEIADA